MLDESTKIRLTVPSLLKLGAATVGIVLTILTARDTIMSQCRQVARDEVQALRVERERVEAHLVTREEWLREQTEVKGSLTELKTLIVDLRDRVGRR